MKLDDDNLAVKTTSSSSAAEQPPVVSVKVQNNVSVVLTKMQVSLFNVALIPKLNCKLAF
jgi:hypothetical protein